jgi:two-component system OmpR family sensor kinase
MKSLLNKNLTQFICCIVVLLLLATPLFYLLTKNYYSEEMIETVTQLNKGGALQPSDLGEDIVEGMVLQLVIIFSVISVSLLIVMRFLTRRLWKPFDDTLSKIEAFNIDSNDIPAFLHSDIREFERLNRSLEKLMQKDKNAYENQKEFTQNASHELQTPIAAIRGKLDLLMQENLSQRQSVLVDDMYNICNRLSRLNKNLLLLAKIENEQFGRKERIDLLEFVRQRIRLFTDLDTDRQVWLDEASMPLVVTANASLLESLLDNLVVNALRHKCDGTSVTISVFGNTLYVINVGVTDTPLNKEMLFKRFANTGDKNRGNGLGLAIVKAICDYHHWSINYDYTDGRHHFTVQF